MISTEYAPSKGALNAASNRVAVVESIYAHFPTNKEFTSSAHKIAETCGSTYSVVNEILRILEDKDALIRRIEYNGQGKTATYTLKDEKAIAILKMKEYNKEVQEQYSIRRRVLDILSTGRTYASVKDIGNALLANGGRSTDFHNLTHILHSMQRDGQISFQTDTSKDKVPYDIRLSKAQTKMNGTAAPKEKEPVMVEAIALPAPTPVVIGKFPLIERMITNKQRLEAAARLAEEGEAEDISIMLLDRAGKPFTPFEAEVAALYKAYIDCQSE